MTIPVSTVPAVRAFLLAAITTQVADPDVQVFNGLDGPDIENDVILIGPVDRHSAPFAMVGDGQAHAISETYSVEVRCSSYRGGDEGDAPTVDARVWALASAVETAVRTDMSLGGLVIVAKPGNSHSDGPQWEDNHKGVVCDVYVSIDVTAQL